MKIFTTALFLLLTSPSYAAVDTVAKIPTGTYVLSRTYFGNCGSDRLTLRRDSENSLSVPEISSTLEQINGASKTSNLGGYVWKTTSTLKDSSLTKSEQIVGTIGGETQISDLPQYCATKITFGADNVVQTSFFSGDSLDTAVETTHCEYRANR